VAPARPGGGRPRRGLLLTFVILFGPQLSYLPILMNDRFDAATYVIGGVLSGASLTTALVSSQLGRLTGRFS
jgi:ACDE family multidrug resistance protein